MVTSSWTCNLPLHIVLLTKTGQDKYSVCQDKFLINPDRIKSFMTYYYWSTCNHQTCKMEPWENLSEWILICLDRLEICPDRLNNKMCISYPSQDTWDIPQCWALHPWVLTTCEAIMHCIYPTLLLYSAKSALTYTGVMPLESHGKTRRSAHIIDWIKCQGGVDAFGKHNDAVLQAYVRNYSKLCIV